MYVPLSRWSEPRPPAGADEEIARQLSIRSTQIWPSVIPFVPSRRLRDRHGYQRLDPGTGKLLRSIWIPPLPWRRSPGRRGAARSELRYRLDLVDNRYVRPLRTKVKSIQGVFRTMQEV